MADRTVVAERLEKGSCQEEHGADERQTVKLRCGERAIPADRMVAAGVLSPLFSLHHFEGELVEGMRIVDSTSTMSDHCLAGCGKTPVSPEPATDHRSLLSVSC